MTSLGAVSVRLLRRSQALFAERLDGRLNPVLGGPASGHQLVLELSCGSSIWVATGKDTTEVRHAAPPSEASPSAPAACAIEAPETQRIGSSSSDLLSLCIPNAWTLIAKNGRFWSTEVHGHLSALVITPGLDVHACKVTEAI